MPSFLFSAARGRPSRAVFDFIPRPQRLAHKKSKISSEQHFPEKNFKKTIDKQKRLCYYNNRKKKGTKNYEELFRSLPRSI